jgi:hypothetical protein
MVRETMFPNKTSEMAFRGSVIPKKPEKLQYYVVKTALSINALLATTVMYLTLT